MTELVPDPFQLRPLSLEMGPKPNVLAAGTPPLLSFVSGAELLKWYRLNLCSKALVDPRGQRVSFLDTDLIHLIKLVDSYGHEPKNRRMAVDQLESGRILLKLGRFDLRRMQELPWARRIVEAPTMIVPNWQVMGRANPGDAYIRNFAAENSRPIYRVLICGHEGLRRRAVTIFPRERFAEHEIRTLLWP